MSPYRTTIPLALGALALLAACGKPEGVPPPAPATAASAGEAPAPATYVGRWAATDALCADGAWVFEDRSLSTAGETSCQFDKVTPNATGYEVEAQCMAEGARAPFTLTLTLTDPASPQSMTASGGPWGGGVTLRRCGA